MTQEEMLAGDLRRAKMSVSYLSRELWKIRKEVDSLVLTLESMAHTMQEGWDDDGKAGLQQHK
jgi:hypothetical protein